MWGHCSTLQLHGWHISGVANVLHCEASYTLLFKNIKLNTKQSLTKGSYLCITGLTDWSIFRKAATKDHLPIINAYAATGTSYIDKCIYVRFPKTITTCTNQKSWFTASGWCNFQAMKISRHLLPILSLLLLVSGSRLNLELLIPQVHVCHKWCVSSCLLWTMVCLLLLLMSGLPSTLCNDVSVLTMGIPGGAFRELFASSLLDVQAVWDALVCACGSVSS